MRARRKKNLRGNSTRPTNFGRKRKMFILRKIWQGWKIFAKTLGKINTLILLTLFLFLILGPIALIKKIPRLFLKKRFQNTFWVKKESEKKNIEDYYRPF